MAVGTIITCPNCGKKNRVRPSSAGVPRCAACQTLLPWVVDADRDSFDAELASSVPVLVDFWAPWCGPCRMVTPALERLARDRAGRLKLVKLNVDGAADIAGSYKVQGIPLIVLHRDGKELDRLVGAVPESQLRQWLDSHIAAAGSTG